MSNDVLTGTPANESLYGGQDNDIYIINKNGGQDTIYDVYQADLYHSYDGGIDTLLFGEGIARENTIFTGKDNGDMVISFKDSSDQVTILGYLNSISRIENINFNYGTVLDYDGVLSTLETYGTEGDETLTGSAYGESIYGFGGVDTIYGSTGNDCIYGNDSDDLIYSQADDDTLAGGAGNDTLYGEIGNDTYIFTSGQDTIYDVYQADLYHTYDGGNDTLSFDEGITQENTIFTGKDNGDLVISFRDSSDQVTIQSYFNPICRIEYVKFNDGTVLDYNGVLSSMETYGTESGETLTGSAYGESIYGFGGADTIYGSTGNDCIYGNDSDDLLYGQADDDTLAGGAGNDTMYGEIGNDTYIFTSGQDTIYDVYQADRYHTYDGGNDTLSFDEGITQENTIFTGKDNGDLVISFKDSSDQVTIQSYFNPICRIEYVKFNDGTVLDYDGVLASLETYGTDGNDTLTGSAYGESIFGLGGNDTIYGSTGNDCIYGNDSDDFLYGQAGNDILSGGAGNDTLYGDVGNDIYIFNVGSGQDTIRDEYNDWIYNYDGGNDTLSFGEGITQENTIFTGKDNGDLVVSFRDSSDQLLIQNGFNANYKIEYVKFNDGTVLDYDGVLASLETYGTDGNDTLTGSAYGESIFGLGGNDTIYGSTGNDCIYGNDSDDFLYGQAGNDTLSGGAGNDTLYGDVGNDIYIFNVGSGQDTIRDEYNDWIYNYDGGNDTLSFGEGITRENTIFTHMDNGDLFVGFRDSIDQLTIQNYFNNNYRIEYVKFNDGTVLDNNGVLTSLETYGTDGDDIITGLEYGESIYGLNGNDSMNAGGGNDFYKFNIGDGQDTILDKYMADGGWTYDDGGNDTISFGSGIDADNVKFEITGNDLIIEYTENDKILVQSYFDARSRIENLVFSDNTVLDYDTVISRLEINGTGNDDNITGSSFGESINGLSGNDTLYGAAGNDTINGGIGNDYLNGSNGNDTYIFSNGQDTIVDQYSADGGWTYTDGGNDTLLFDVNLSDLSFQESGNNLEIILNATDDEITILNQYDSNYRIENFRFADNTVLDYSQIDNYTNRHIYGSNGNDSLTSGYASDTIVAQDGDDTITAGSGNDIIEGGSGNDIYVFNGNTGYDEITEGSGSDTIQFGEDIILDDLNFTKEDGDLLISIADNTGNIRIKNYYSDDGYRVEQIQFSDSRGLTQLQIEALAVFGGTENDDILEGVGSAAVYNIHGDAGNDSIVGGYGDDYLYGEEGNDTIDGGYGNDTIFGGTGDDSLYGNQGNDSYKFSINDGNDTIFDSDGNDTIEFSDSLHLDNFDFRIYPDNTRDLVIRQENGSNTLTIVGFYDDLGFSSTNGIENFIFGDTILSGQEIQSRTVLMGTDQEDAIQLDFPIAGIECGNNSDIINMGRGDNNFLGGSGNDSYILTFNTDGNDTKTLFDSEGEADTIELQDNSNVFSGNLSYGISQDDFVITINEAGHINTIIIQDYFEYKTNEIEILQPEGGTAITVADEVALLAKIDSEDKRKINGTSRDNIIFARGGNDSVSGLAGNDYLNGGLGNDTIRGGDGNDTIKGSDGNDYIYGDKGNNLIYGDSGSDIITSISGNDVIYGGTGDDTYKISSINTVINEYLDEGTDRIITGVNNYSLGDNIENLSLTGSAISATGNSLDNYITGNSMKNTLTGNDGNDTLDGGANADVLIGGAGNDTYIIDRLTDRITDLSGTDTVISKITYTISDMSIENLKLSGTTSINATGNGLNNILVGNTGKNIIDGLAGDDTMEGGVGNDTYIIDSINDVINETTNVKEIDTVKSTISYTLGTNLENLILLGTSDLSATGNSSKNTITGNSGNNTLSGNEGADVLIGGAGDDVYEVDNSSDKVIELANGGSETVRSTVTYTLGSNVEDLRLVGTSDINGKGNSLNNKIYGNNYDNILTGAAGMDTMYGGAGNDTYMLSSTAGKDTIDDTAGTDTVLFDSTVLKSKIALFKDESGNLIIDYGTTKGVNKITVIDQDTHSIEKLQLSNGQFLTFADINDIVNSISAYDASHSELTITSINDVKSNTYIMTTYITSQWHT